MANHKIYGILKTQSVNCLFYDAVPFVGIIFLKKCYRTQVGYYNLVNKIINILYSRD